MGFRWVWGLDRILVGLCGGPLVVEGEDVGEDFLVG
jgi:hypothetical protein